MGGRQKLFKWYIEQRIAYIMFRVQNKFVQVHAGSEAIRWTCKFRLLLSNISQ